LSYPNHKQKLTGFRYEPWHFRFVGSDTAREIADNGWAIEEYFRAHPDRARSGNCEDCPHLSSRATCGDIGELGRCDGTVLSFCLEGFLANVDCSTSGLECTVDGESADCQPPVSSNP